MISNHAISGLGNDSPSLQTQARTNIPSRVCLLMCSKMQNYSHCCSPKYFMYTHLLWDLFWNHSHYGKNLWATYGGLGRWLGLPLFWPTPHSSCTSLLCPCVLFSTIAVTFPFLHLPFSLSIRFQTLAPNNSSTYEANPALLSTWSTGVGTLWILMLPLTPKCWARHFNFCFLIVSLGG